MNRQLLIATMLMAVFCLTGCVEIHQLVKMNRDGSGTLIETVRVLPRAVRLMAGRMTREGKAAEGFQLLADQALQRRIQAFGGVTVKSKNQKTLPDGALELVVVYDFKDVNKVTFWTVPTFTSTDPKRKGNFQMQYARVVHQGWSKKYMKMDQMSIRFGRHPTQQKFSSPSVVQDYRRVASVFQDMLKDFKFEIQIQGPPDLEQYEAGDMVNGMPVEGTIVTPYRVYGENVTLDAEVVRSFLMGEYGGRSDAWGGSWRGMEKALPNTVTPYGSGYGGMSVRFLKTPVEVPAPGGGGKKK